MIYMVIIDNVGKIGIADVLFSHYHWEDEPIVSELSERIREIRGLPELRVDKYQQKRDLRNYVKYLEIDNILHLLSQIVIDDGVTDSQESSHIFIVKLNKVLKEL